MPRYQPRFVASKSIDFRRTISPSERRLQIQDDLSRLARELHAATAAGIPLVYAVTRAEAPVVKIGFSRHLAGRRGRLARMPGCRIVAAIAGGRADEAEVHKRLAEHRVRMELRGAGCGEHFWICGDVLDWINEARQVIDLDPLTLDHLLAA